MTALARPQLWIPGAPSLLRRPRRVRRWLRALLDPLAHFVSGDQLLDDSGNDMLDDSGNDMLDGGSAVCCIYQARDCATNTLQSLYVRKSQFPAFPATYYFKLSGTCYYVQTSDKVACSNTPNVSGETAFASCAACAPSCPGLTSPSSLSIAGIEDFWSTCAACVLPPDGATFDDCNAIPGIHLGCGGACDEWDDIVTWVAADSWDSGFAPDGSGYVFASNNCCFRFQGVTITCAGGTWTVTLFFNHSGDASWWTKVGGSSPVGTYAYAGSSPGTLTNPDGSPCTPPNITVS
jgi:hypothetical protein